MRILNRISRRAVLAGQAALAGLMALPGHAATRVAPATDCAAKPAACLPPRWHSATAEELAGLVGDRFRIRTQGHGNLVMRLVSVEPNRSGPARPDHLPRREGVTAVFDSPDMAPLVAQGYGTHQVYHPRVGRAELHLQAVPRRSGGHFIEAVLN